jgi:hypothetical protein
VKGSSFNKLVGTTNPSFWTVLRAIQLDECENILNKKHISKAKDSKLFDLCNQHKQKQISNYEFSNYIYFTRRF